MCMFVICQLYLYDLFASMGFESLMIIDSRSQIRQYELLLLLLIECFNKQVQFHLVNFFMIIFVQSIS